eukprot:SAG31_NODE_23386_length_505_cov_1.261084_2_plen_72_part_01
MFPSHLVAISFFLLACGNTAVRLLFLSAAAMAAAVDLVEALAVEAVRYLRPCWTLVTIVQHSQSVCGDVGGG